MAEFSSDIERRKSFDFFVLRQVMQIWQLSADNPGLAERIVDDVTPLPDEGLHYGERSMNEKRKALVALLTREEYTGFEPDNDPAIRSLLTAIRFADEDSVAQDALVTLLQTYRVQKRLALPTQEVADPRGIAFRILNPRRGSQP